MTDSGPPPIALAIALDLVTRHRLRLVDQRDSRLGELTGQYELATAAWAGGRAGFVGFFRPRSDAATARADLAARIDAAHRWGLDRLGVQHADRCDILLIALGPIDAVAAPAVPADKVRVGVVAIDPEKGSVTTLRPIPTGLPTARELKSRVRSTRKGEATPTLAAVDLAERQVIAGSYAGTATPTRSQRPIVTYGLISAFVAIFLAEVALIHDTSAGELTPTILDFGAIADPKLYPDANDWWRYISSAFLHVNSGAFIIHVAFNSLAMWNVGRLVEQLYGRLVLLGTFLATAAIGNAAWVVATIVGASAGGISLGASGGIAGLIGLLVMLGRVQGRSFPASIAATIRQSALTSIVMTVFLGFAVARVNNFAHVGGFIGGIALALMLPPVASVGGRPLRRYERLFLCAIIAVGAVALLLAGMHLVTAMMTATGP